MELSVSDYEKIKNGDTLEIQGQGFLIEGEVAHDTWRFDAGNIDVFCENGFQVFQGNIEDIIHIEKI